MEAHTTVSSRTLFQGKKINLRLDEVRLPDGSVHQREIVEHRGAVALVAIDDDQQVLLVRQYRAPAGRVLLELPAGTLDAGEDPALCARRELEEETGCTAERLERLLGFYTTPGFTTEYMHVYLATGLQAGPQRLEADEDIELERRPLAEALELIERGEICDAKSIIGLWAFARRASQAD